jgi:hypothetical protein
MKPRTEFSFQRFAELLRRTLEISIIIAAIIRTALMVEWFVAGGRISRRSLIESVDTFLIICVLLFLLVAIYRLCLDGRRAAVLGLRALAYIVFVIVSPAPLGLQSLSAVELPRLNFVAQHLLGLKDEL